MFILVPFISSTGFAVVAEAILRCGDCLSKKMSSQYLQLFFYFGLDYQTLLEFFKFERQKCLFGIGKALFTCWWHLGVSNYRFQFFICGIMYFCVSISDAVFLVTNFPFLITVSDWYYHFDVFNFFQLFNSNGVVVVALAKLRWKVFAVRKNCCNKLVVSTSYWSRLLNVSSVLTSLKYIATLFWFVFALWVRWKFTGILRFWF